MEARPQGPCRCTVPGGRSPTVGELHAFGTAPEPQIETGRTSVLEHDLTVSLPGAATDRVPDLIAAMVYVDTAPGKLPLDPSQVGDKPMVWDEVSAEENFRVKLAAS